MRDRAQEAIPIPRVQLAGGVDERGELLVGQRAASALARAWDPPTEGFPYGTANPPLPNGAVIAGQVHLPEPAELLPTPAAGQASLPLPRILSASPVPLCSRCATSAPEGKEH
jgi:hypothetical protein